VIAQTYEVRDLDFAEKGLDRIEWALTEMPVVEALKDEFERDRPLEGLRVSGCPHITTASICPALWMGSRQIDAFAKLPGG
jgi:adenosylhomocysteinase